MFDDNDQPMGVDADAQRRAYAADEEAHRPVTRHVLDDDTAPVAPQTVAEQALAAGHGQQMPGYVAPPSAAGGAQEYEDGGNHYEPGPGSVSVSMHSRGSAGVAGLTRREHRPVIVQLEGPWGTVTQPFSYVFRDDICLVLITDHRRLQTAYELPPLKSGDQFVRINVHINGETVPCVWAGIRFTMPDNSATFTVLPIDE